MAAMYTIQLITFTTILIKTTFVKSGVLDFVTSCANLENARKISDHLPVFLELTVKRTELNLDPTIKLNRNN
jgi:hypothetical protein